MNDRVEKNDDDDDCDADVVVVEGGADDDADCDAGHFSEDDDWHEVVEEIVVVMKMWGVQVLCYH